MSNVTVPVFGFGISPRGPRTRPSLPTTPIWSGVAIATSKSRNPSSIFVARSAEPTTSAPASSASRAFSPSANTATRMSFPMPCGKHDRPAKLLVGVAHVQAEPEVRLDRLVESGAVGFLENAHRFARRVGLLAVDQLERRAVALAMGAHGVVSTPIERAVPAITFIASSTSRAFRAGIFVSAIEAEVGLAEPTDLVTVRLAGAFLQVERFLDQYGRGRSLRDEAEGAIFEDGDLDGRDAAVLLRRLRVERLAELHDVDPVLTEGRADGRSRVRLPTGDLQFDECEYFLGHQSIFFTWSKLSSTGT